VRSAQPPPAPVHLLLLARWFPPRVGGVESYLGSLYDGLVGARITVLAPHEGEFESYDALRHSFTIRRVAAGPSNRKTVLVGLLIAAVRTAARERVTQIHCGHVLLGLAGLICKRLFGIPFVVFAYGSDVAATRFSGWRRLVLSRADAVVTISHATVALLLNMGLNPQKIRLVPPIVDADSYKPSRERRAAFRKSYDIEPDSPVVLTVCRLTRFARHKGVDDLIGAISVLAVAHPDTTLIIVGDGDDRLRLEAIATERGVSTRTAFLGQLPPDALLSAYAAADIFVLANKPVTDDARPTVEGFGIVLLEAAASGIPSVATTFGGAPDAVEHGVTGLVVDAAQPDGISEALRRLLDSPSERLAMGRRARLKAQDRHASTVVTSLFETSVVSNLLRAP
jgi:phosphatidylinositol alpha-1,6-mannosyltransferase